VDEGDGIVGAGCELAADGLGIDGLAPFKLEGAGRLPAAERDVVPLSENAPFMQVRTFFFVTLRMAPSITPQALLVER